MKNYIQHHLNKRCIHILNLMANIILSDIVIFSTIILFEE